MVKYFCDICGKEVQKEDCLDTIKINTDNFHSYHNVYYSACESCRINISNYILKMKEESKNGNT